MDSNKRKEFARHMKHAREKSRGYADFFGWSIDRDIEEWGVVTAFSESLDKNNESFFKIIEIRGRGNDPPDCEATLFSGGKIAIEVTELVDEEAIRKYKSGVEYAWADWDKEKFIGYLEKRLMAKNNITLQGGPYAQYLVLIHTDEPIIDIEFAQECLRDTSFTNLNNIDSAYLLISYDPEFEKCPYIKLTINEN